MLESPLLVALAALAACGRQAPADGNAAIANAAAVEQSGDECAQPELLLADGRSSLSSSLIEETKANFVTAFRRACAKGNLEQKELFDAKAEDQGKLFLINAPEANVAS